MIQIANAPCSWGVLEFGLDGKTGECTRVLDEMQETGYAGTELGDWGFMPTDPESLKSVLTARQLHLLGGFVPVALTRPEGHEPGLANALRTARLLAGTANGGRIILADDNATEADRTKKAGRIQPSDGLTPEQWKVFADGVHRIALRVFEETGLQTVFHHHCAGYVETPDEIGILLDLTDPDIVGLCFDTGHYRFGGGDPVEGIQKYGDRIKHVHFKDCHPGLRKQSAQENWDYLQSVGNGVFCELGRGEVDFPGVLAGLRKIEYDDWIVVEQDILPGMGKPLDSARRNRDYLKSIGV
ncbi:MAG: TIM barrel protein [Balneolales bacterium]